jgi:hypothetical protein
MNAIDILTAARAKIARPEDWGKGPRTAAVIRSMETCCAAEAIDESDQPFSYGRMEAYRAFDKAAGIAQDASTYSTIASWNDAPERTHAEVLAAFDLAITTLKLG